MIEILVFLGIVIIPLAMATFGISLIANAIETFKRMGDE
jgi:hypothetical protein